MRAFAERPDGSIWIGTSSGLLRWKEGAFRMQTVKDGLSSDAIEALYVDGDDLWIGTYGGGIDLLRERRSDR